MKALTALATLAAILTFNIAATAYLFTHRDTDPWKMALIVIAMLAAWEIKPPYEDPKNG